MIYLFNYENFQESHIPLEYDISIIDERFKFFEDYNYNYYQLFINEGKKILKKYKIDCNPKNNRLILFDNNCTFDYDPHLHGGHPCGEN